MMPPMSQSRMYTLTLTELELALTEELAQYALQNFEAENPREYERFRLACEGLRAKAATLRAHDEPLAQRGRLSGVSAETSASTPSEDLWWPESPTTVYH